MFRTFVVLLVTLLAWTPLWAQEEELGYERIEFRVSSTMPGGRVVIDRGRRDGVVVGDLVFLYPRDGGTYRGRVFQIEERSAVIKLRNKGFAPDPGTRGEIIFPKGRLAPVEPEVTETPPQEIPQVTEDPVETQEAPEHPPWENEDEEWTPDQPLLALVEPVHPKDRETRVTGRIYYLSDTVYTTEDDFNNSVMRNGADVRYENPFGRGGALNISGEINYKRERNDNDGFDALVDRLSYTWGGTRFDKTRWEFGRFLQYGMPEFGIVDGLEWGRRRKNGDRYGVSVGSMPELDDDFETGDDLQFSAYYHWVMGDREQLTIGTGYQKTFHNGDRDRDLLVTKIHYLPIDGWDFHGTAWVDFYSDHDDIKDKDFELTQAVVSTGRTWESGNGVDLAYRHLAFPEIDRNGEFLEILYDEIEDNRLDRLSLSGWTWFGENMQINAEIGVWDDEDEEGWDTETGFDVRNVFSKNDRTELSGYYADGQFEWVLGARVSYTKYLENGSWGLLYDYSNHHEVGFSDDIDDVAQHRLRMMRDYYWGRGWTLSLYGEAYIFDGGDEGAYSTGFYLQKSF